MLKHLLFPGLVESRTDSNMHYVSAARLIELYQVPLSECLIVRYPHDLHGIDTAGLIELRPRYDGKYPSLKESTDGR